MIERIFARKIKIIVAALCISFAGSSLFAVEEYVASIYKQIDAAFSQRSEKDLEGILKNNSKDRNYFLIENYTEKKIRRLLINNDFEFAESAVIVVIENNIDNERAVDMYTSIMDASQLYKKQKESEQLAEAQRQQKIEKEKESKRDSVNKVYVESKKADGGSVYISGRDTKQSRITWRGAFGIVDVSNIMEQDVGLNLLNYGINLNYTHEVEFEKFTLGCDGSASFRFLSLTGGEEKAPLLVDIDAVPKLGFPTVFRFFFLRCGFTGLIIGKAKTGIKNRALVDNFYSPVLGFQLGNIYLGKVGFTFNYDYYPGHLFYSDVNLAMGGAVNFAIPFAEIERVKLTFNAGLKDRVFVKENGIENRANLVLAIGVENVNR